MTSYTTIRLDMDSMKMLEEIITKLQDDNIGKLSKTATLKYIIGCYHDSVCISPNQKEINGVIK